MTDTRTIRKTPLSKTALLLHEFLDALNDIDAHTPYRTVDLTRDVMTRLDGDMEVLIAAWYRLHVAAGIQRTSTPEGRGDSIGPDVVVQHYG